MSRAVFKVVIRIRKQKAIKHIKRHYSGGQRRDL